MCESFWVAKGIEHIICLNDNNINNIINNNIIINNIIIINWRIILPNLTSEDFQICNQTGNSDG